MKDQYGKRTIAKDGVEYKSIFEAEVVNRLLYEKPGITYEYERRYSQDTRHTCDFYVPELDLYMEAVYNNVETVPLYRIRNQDVWLDVDYHQKDVAKSYGARWSGSVKRWFLPAAQLDKPGCENLEKYMPPELLERTMTFETEQMTKEYNERLSEKLTLYQGRHKIIMVHNEDLGRYSGLYGLIKAKDQSLFGFLLKTNTTFQAMREVARTPLAKKKEDPQPQPKQPKPKAIRSRLDRFVQLVNEATPQERAIFMARLEERMRLG